MRRLGLLLWAVAVSAIALTVSAVLAVRVVVALFSVVALAVVSLFVSSLSIAILRTSVVVSSVWLIRIGIFSFLVCIGAVVGRLRAVVSGFSLLGALRSVRRIVATSAVVLIALAFLLFLFTSFRVEACHALLA